ncbi:MAG: hypothetical protein RBT37_01010 [Dissulfurispiraceae bacterium]|jgi:hypothetical protein|nr:hypothetical protein [Dissulfurispiraceae bacterium]
MKLDRIMIGLGAAAFAAIIIALIIPSQVKFEFKPAPIELEINSALPEELNIKEREIFYTKNMVSPMLINKTVKKGFPNTPLETIAPAAAPQEPTLNISMILINNLRKMAIINGIVLSEGDMIGNDRVLKIEKDRVSIRSSKGERWVKLSQ